MKKWILIILGVTAGLIILVVGLVFGLSEDKPTGTAGPEADAFAREVMASVNTAAWDTTGAVSWIFNGSSAHKHLWDRKRHYAQVEWPDTRVILDINAQKGKAWVKDVLQEGKAANDLVHTAWTYWANDAFWLNPIAKLFDDGTSRELVELEGGEQALLITYNQGGVTPGDAYLWRVDENKRPIEWKMWVQIIPVGGMATTWEGWKQLSTGAWVANTHESGAFTLTLEEIKGAANLEELTGGEDPFAEL